MVDWPGLLNWTLKYHDGTKDNEAKMMSPEDRKWLEEALEAYTFDEIKQMKETMDKLSEPENPKDPQDSYNRVILLENLLDLVEGLESARDLIKMGKYPILIQVMFNSQYDEVRKQAYLVFQSCNVNNSFVQIASVNHSAFNLMNSILREEELGNREFAVSALASVIKGDNLDIKRQFLEAKGVEFLLELLNDDKKMKSPKIKTKAITLLTDLLHYDDMLGYRDMIDYNLSQKGNGQSNIKITNKKPEEESKDAVKEQEDFLKYKGIVKQILMDNNFVTIGWKYMEEKDLRKFIDYRPAYLSCLITLQNAGFELKLNEDQKGYVKGLKKTLLKEAEAAGDIYENECNLIDILLS